MGFSSIVAFLLSLFVVFQTLLIISLVQGQKTERSALFGAFSLCCIVIAGAQWLLEVEAAKMEVVANTKGNTTASKSLWQEMRRDSLWQEMNDLRLPRSRSMYGDAGSADVLY